jgi:hypothetical protein
MRKRKQLAARVCIEDGTLFRPKRRGNAVLCSVRCRMRRWRRSKRESKHDLMTWADYYDKPKRK